MECYLSFLPVEYFETKGKTGQNSWDMVIFQAQLRLIKIKRTFEEGSQSICNKGTAECWFRPTVSDFITPIIFTGWAAAFCKLWISCLKVLECRIVHRFYTNTNFLSVEPRNRGSHNNQSNLRSSCDAVVEAFGSLKKSRCSKYKSCFLKLMDLA